jgi:hypothetical protein
MNLQRINEMRAEMGLKPLQADPRKAAAKRRQSANRAARGQECRDLKSSRSSGRKGK